MRRVVSLVLVFFLAMVTLFAGGQEEKESGGWRIALCNDYAGNSWRQQMIKNWEAVVAQAKAEGLIAEGPAFTTNESSAAEQAALLQNLVLEGYDAIVLDAASPTALNGAVAKAVEAGIPVVCFDQTVTDPSAWKLITDFYDMGEAEVEHLHKVFPAKAVNILEIRGMAGTFADDEIHKAIVETSDKYSNLTVVGEVYGNWTQSVAQKEVAGILPSLPEIQAVVAQGGDGYGSLKAFENAGRPAPLQIFGHRYDELVIWKEMQKNNGGSYPSMSVSIVPGSVSTAFWTALEILNGNDVPKEIHMSPMVFGEEQLDYFLEHTEKGGLADLSYPQEWVQELIANAKADKPAPADPLP